MHHNKLSDLPASLRNLTSLQVFRVNNNYLTEFPEEVLVMQSLYDLDISENPIRVIPAEIVELQKLRYFYFLNVPLDQEDQGNRHLVRTLHRMRNRGTIINFNEGSYDEVNND